MPFHHTLHGPEGQFLRWRPDKAADYVAHLEQDTPARQKLYRAIHNENVEQAWSCSRSWILEVALHTGMTSGTHAPKRPAQRERAAWFDEECRKKKQMLLNLVMKGRAPHIRDQLLREYRAQTQRCQRRFINSKHF